jgi:glucose/arabinose dehydrogenase
MFQLTSLIALPPETDTCGTPARRIGRLHRMPLMLPRENPMIRTLLAAGALALCAAAAQAESAIEHLRVPPGFSIELWAEVDNPRAMTLGEARRLYVGSRKGHVSAVPFDGTTMKAGKAVRVASGLNMPVGVAWRKGDLYVSSLDRIVKLPGIDNRLAMHRRSHRWSAIASRRTGRTAGNSSPSGRTTSSMFRSARRATSVTATAMATPTSCA